ncbi:hypothetical protein PG994_012356 [Apiospora phragmitis]|uniref:Restriction of telomere capping protein 4 n=1 Tax=Apiospora phragmitis TaxID=2905665 RepID=A0ABR1TVF7_9PEZI
MASSNSKRSQSRAQSTSLSETENSSGPNIAEKKHKRRKRDANVYDAVAGRVTTTIPLEDASDSDATTPYRRDQAGRLRDPTLAPEEVLFRRVKAPIRFAEKDVYHAHEALPGGGREVLPDSDMLKAIHGYASHFYAALGAAARGPGAAGSRSSSSSSNIDEQSMDETALIAFGILLEEAVRDALGKRGDLVFTEGQQTVGQELCRDVTVGLLDADSLPRSRPTSNTAANSSGKGRVE